MQWSYVFLAPTHPYVINYPCCDIIYTMLLTGALVATCIRLQVWGNRVCNWLCFNVICPCRRKGWPRTATREIRVQWQCFNHVCEWILGKSVTQRWYLMTNKSFKQICFDDNWKICSKLYALISNWPYRKGYSFWSITTNNSNISYIDG